MLKNIIKQERALVFTSLFALILVLLRVQHLGGPCKQSWEMVFCPSMLFLFLVWNLFLAWIPLLIGHLLVKKAFPKWLAWLFIMVWLFFFPNAPYLITDLIHLKKRLDIPFWYDAFLLFTYAYLGVWLAIKALHKMRIYLYEKESVFIGKSFITITLLLSGLGIYLGRIERWNSWDLFTRPNAVLKSVINLFVHPMSHQQVFLMMGMFSILLSLVYWLSFYSEGEGE